MEQGENSTWIDLRVGANPPLRLSAGELSSLIEKLIGIRRRMAPPVGPVPLDESVQVLRAQHMHMTAFDEPDRRMAIALFHPGLGWVGFELDGEGTRRLAATVVRALPPAGTGRAN